MSLEEAQAELDSIEKDIVANKNARLALAEEAKVLRDKYLEAEAARNLQPKPQEETE